MHRYALSRARKTEMAGVRGSSPTPPSARQHGRGKGDVWSTFTLRRQRHHGIRAPHSPSGRLRGRSYRVALLRWAVQRAAISHKAGAVANERSHGCGKPAAYDRLVVTIMRVFPRVGAAKPGEERRKAGHMGTRGRAAGGGRQRGIGNAGGRRQRGRASEVATRAGVGGADGGGNAGGGGGAGGEVRTRRLCGGGGRRGGGLWRRGWRRGRAGRRCWGRGRRACRRFWRRGRRRRGGRRRRRRRRGRICR